MQEVLDPSDHPVEPRPVEKCGPHRCDGGARHTSTLLLPVSLDASIVIPTLNEALNLDPLVPRIHRAMADRSYEIVVVDDGSTDGTVERCVALADVYPIRVLRRAVPVGGLAGAVLHGFQKAHGRILVVMDADLQHPPESLPQLVIPLMAGAADFVLGSRYASGGTISPDWTFSRRIVSYLARLSCRPLSRGVGDPMSGYFAMTREAYARSDPLDPIGFKIALEILCKCKSRRIVEIPISFSVREHGTSKLTLTQMRNYLRHLRRLYQYWWTSPYRTLPRPPNA